MRLGSLIAGAGLLAALGSPPAGAVDPFFPEFGNDGYDVQSYDLNLNVDPAKNHLAGRATLAIRALSRLETVTLDLSRLAVKTATVNGVAAPFTHSGGKLRIRLPGAIAKGTAFKVAVTYAGSPKPIDDPTAPGAGYGLGWTPWAGTTYVVSEPVGAGTWYPVNDQPTDKATYRVTVTVPKPFTAISNGLLESTTDLGAGRRFIWRQREPMASYLAIVHVGNYNVERSWARGALPLRTYTTTETPPETIAALQKTAAMISTFEPLAGPYPFSSYGSVVVDDPALYYSLETQAMTTFEGGNIPETTVAHELAHQWFGDAVTVKNWRDLWLAEGFATYFELLWLNRGDRAGLDSDFCALYDHIVDNEIGPAVVSQPEDIFADNTYYRGALTLQALRLKVGDEAFFRTLKTYYRAYRYQNATSSNFIEVAVRQGDQPGIRALFNAWLYDEAIPPLGCPQANAKVAAVKAQAKLPFDLSASRHHRR